MHPEAEQDRLTELLNSTKSELLGVTITLETGPVGGKQKGFIICHHVTKLQNRETLQWLKVYTS